MQIELVPFKVVLKAFMKGKKRFVATENTGLTYHHVTSYEAAVKLTKTLVKRDKADFIDGIMYSKNYGVIMEGSFTSDTGLPLATFHKASDDWFFLHGQRCAD